jgi:dihydroxyacetone kinase-like protein
MKKIINDPKKVVSELLEGLEAAYQGKVRRLEEVGALVKSQIPKGKVAVLIGGGSGHEPLFPGFIGRNMADGAACGNIFAAPTPDVILAATRVLDQGKGVLYVYGNYAGDNLNFDLALEMAEQEGIKIRTVRVWDDVAAAPPEKIEERRGIAGDLFVIKTAGAATSRYGDLEEVYRMTAKARDNTRSMGVSISAGSIPETGEPTFELGEDEIEIGMGLHGEAGVWRKNMAPADELVEDMVNRIAADLPFEAGDEVCLLVNDLGATTWMELLIVNRMVHQVLERKAIRVYDTIVGSYCTCQEMAGFSLTMMRLDEELKELHDLPASSLGFSKAG